MAPIAESMVSMVLLWTLVLLAGAQRASGDVKRDTVTHMDKDGMLWLNDQLYGQFVKPRARKQYWAVFMTSSAHPCEACAEALLHFQSVAASWHAQTQGQMNQPPSTDVLHFAAADFPNVQELFRDVQLQYIPVILLLKPKQAVNKGRIIQFRSVHDLIRAINSYGDFSLEYREPPSRRNLILVVSMICVAFLALLNGHYNLVPVLSLKTQRSGWAFGTVLLTLAFTGGLMWSLMNDAQWFYMDQRSKQAMFVAPSNDMQFVAEVLIVILVNGAISTGMVLLGNMRQLKCVGRWRGSASIVALMLCGGFFVVMTRLVSMKIHYYHPWDFWKQLIDDLH